MNHRRSTHDGFSLTELLFVVSIFVVLAGIAVPTTINVTEALRVSAAGREIERELQTARLKAVQSNRTLRVRFDCPASGQYRRVEVMGTGIDTAPARCAESTYPFPSQRDTSPATPAHDGPLRFLPQGIATSLPLAGQAIEFRPNGTAMLVTAGGREAIASGGVGLMVSKGTHSATVNVNALGRIEIH